MDKGLFLTKITNTHTRIHTKITPLPCQTAPQPPLSPPNLPSLSLIPSQDVISCVFVPYLLHLLSYRSKQQSAATGNFHLRLNSSVLASGQTHTFNHPSKVFWFFPKITPDLCGIHQTTIMTLHRTRSLGLNPENWLLFFCSVVHSPLFSFLSFSG